MTFSEFKGMRKRVDEETTILTHGRRAKHNSAMQAVTSSRLSASLFFYGPCRR